MMFSCVAKEAKIFSAGTQFGQNSEVKSSATMRGFSSAKAVFENVI